MDRQWFCEARAIHRSVPFLQTCQGLEAMLTHRLTGRSALAGPNIDDAAIDSQSADLSGTPSPDTPQRELVGSFHTHPNTQAEGYIADPSPSDRAFVRMTSHVPEIIETHEGRKTIAYP
jgi:hypothetical protein